MAPLGPPLAVSQQSYGSPRRVVGLGYMDGLEMFDGAYIQWPCIYSMNMVGIRWPGKWYGIDPIDGPDPGIRRPGGSLLRGLCVWVRRNRRDLNHLRSTYPAPAAFNMHSYPLGD